MSKVVYEPRVLRFGMRLSPSAWTKVLRPVVAAFRARGHRINAYVDGFAATGRHGRSSTAADATAGRVEILALFSTLGLHVHPTKGVSTCARELHLLGFLFDTQRRFLLFTASRLAALIVGAKALLTAARRDGRRVRHCSLQRFTGTAVSCSLAVHSALFFIQRLYDVQGGIGRRAPSDEVAASAWALAHLGGPHSGRGAF